LDLNLLESLPLSTLFKEVWGPENLQKIKVVGEEAKNVIHSEFKKPAAYKSFTFKSLSLNQL